MNIKSLDFTYPPHLIATQRPKNSRTLFSATKGPEEITKKQLLDEFKAGDVLVYNETKVLPCRLKAQVSSGSIEVLFIKNEARKWEVLLPLKQIKKAETLKFPQGLQGQVIQGGRPQVLEVNQDIKPDYFDQFGEMAIPPYIEKARKKSQLNVSKDTDKQQYQTDFAKNLGSLAAPTASFHFNQEDFKYLQKAGVKVLPLTLHVGLGTFLPIETSQLSDHKMHKEWVYIPKASLEVLENPSGRVWALGTTVTRSLEALALGKFSINSLGDAEGSTDLFIFPPFKFQKVDVLMTNFHQPQSTLLALVMAFAGQDRVKQHYKWAIENEFKLFSFGDLSIWKK